MNLREMMSAMKNCILILIVLSIFQGKVDAFSGDYLGNENIWFIPGWKSGNTQTKLYEKDLKETFNENCFVLNSILRWGKKEDKAGGGIDWEKNKNTAEQSAEMLVRRLEILPKEKRDKIILIGHSLGARIITYSCSKLIEKEILLKRIIFLGAAVDYDEEKLQDVVKVSKEKPLNIFNPNDKVLSFLYKAREGKIACGAQGIESDIADFEQYIVSPVEKRKTLLSGYQLHYANEYLRTLKGVMDGQYCEKIDKCVTILEREKIYFCIINKEYYGIVDSRGTIVMYGKDREKIYAGFKNFIDKGQK